MDEILKKPKRLQQIQLVGLPPFTIEMATGERALLLKEMNKEVDKFAKSGELDKQVMSICAIIKEFSSFETAEDVFNSLTEFELMDVYFSISGDNESIKKLMTLTK
jgi:hypothetical protein